MRCTFFSVTKRQAGRAESAQNVSPRRGGGRGLSLGDKDLTQAWEEGAL